MTAPENFSKRSAILRKVLKFINEDDWRDYGTYMVFGPAPHRGDLDSAGNLRSDSLMRLHQQFGETLDRYLGLKLSRERTTLSGQPADSEFLGKLRALPPDFLRHLNEVVFDGEIADPTPENILRQIKEAIASKDELEAQKGGSILHEHAIDDLDSLYCKEVLDKLGSIVSRVSGLEAMRLQSIPNNKVRRCFEEATRCYLYGFSMACAAMCRAILESALKDVFDPGKELGPTQEDKKLGGRRASYFLKLVDNAVWRGRLSKALGEPGGPADQVKDAGDAAVHDANKFAAEFPAKKVEWLLDRTRDILVELYGTD